MSLLMVKRSSTVMTSHPTMHVFFGPFLFDLLILVSIATSQYAPVMEWDVCSPSRLIVTLTGGQEGGIIYIRGYGSACKQDTTSIETTHEFVFSTCGIDTEETYFTIIVQKNPLYQTGDDLQESLLCIYDLSDIGVGNNVNVGDDTDDAGVNKTVKPTAHMSLYKDGEDIGGSEVKLGETVTMTIQLDEPYPETFDIKAKSCTANFIQITQDFSTLSPSWERLKTMHEAFTTIERQGCAEDTSLFPEFSHVTQGIITSSFGAFRTTDMGSGLVEMTYTCTLQVCLGPCNPTTCTDDVDGWGRRKRDVTSGNDVSYDDINVGTSMSVGTDIDVRPMRPGGDDSICINTIAFLVALVAMVFALVTTACSTAVVTGRMLRRTEELRLFTHGYENELRTVDHNKSGKNNKFSPFTNSIKEIDLETKQKRAEGNSLANTILNEKSSSLFSKKILNGYPMTQCGKDINSDNQQSVVKRASNGLLQRTSSRQTLAATSVPTEAPRDQFGAGASEKQLADLLKAFKKELREADIQNQLTQCRELIVQLGMEHVLPKVIDQK